MPYISVEAQNSHKAVVEAIEKSAITTTGELNFLITNLIVSYMKTNGGKYAQMNDVIGALDSAKAEFQQRVVNPYEKQKAFEADAHGVDPYRFLRLNDD